MKKGFLRDHRGLFPIAFVAVISSGYLACGDETIEPTLIEDAGPGLDVNVPKDDGSAVDANKSDGSSTPDSTTDAPDDSAAEDATDAPDDSPTSNGG